MAAAAEAAAAEVNFVGLHVRSSSRHRRCCRRSGEWSSKAGAAAAVCRLHQCVAAGGDCAADDVVADRRMARWARVRRRVAHRVQCGWRRVEVMVRRLRRQPRMHRPARAEARVADAAAAGGASPEASSQYGRWGSAACHIYIPETVAKELQMGIMRTEKP